MYITDGEEHDGMTLHIINKIGGFFRKKKVLIGGEATQIGNWLILLFRVVFIKMWFFLFGWTAPGAGRRRRIV